MAYTLDQLRSLPASRAPVDRCVCHDVTFSEILGLHGRGLDLEAIRARTHCSTSCGLCGPYIRASLATGITRFPVMSDAELEGLAAGASGSDRA
jgi:NAD(P)H-nitrite reductase large subunit